MGDKSSIEWTDATWNPVTGCDRVSPGCDNCYAATMAKRLKAMGSPRYQTDGDPRTSGPGFGVATHDDVLVQPLRWRRARKVFVNSMSDLFHPRVPDDFIAACWAVMWMANHHTFQVLTKRPKRARALLNSDAFWVLVCTAFDRFAEGGIPVGDGAVAAGPDYPLDNVWVGTSVEDQERADERVPALLEIPAAVRFLSCEPLLGALDLRPWLNPGRACAATSSARPAPSTVRSTQTPDSTAEAATTRPSSLAGSSSVASPARAPARCTHSGPATSATSASRPACRSCSSSGARGSARTT